MKFSAIMNERGSVESFTRYVTAVAKLCKKRCVVKITAQGVCFIGGDSFREGGSWLSVLITPRPTFFNFSFVGLSPDKPTIMLELDVDVLSKILAGAHLFVKLKLAMKDQMPVLRIDVRGSEIVLHEIPVSVLQSKNWPVYDKPNVGQQTIGIYLPQTRAVQKVLQGMKNIQSKYVTMKVSNNGELQLEGVVENANVTIYFNDLTNDTIPDGVEEIEWATVKLNLKLLHTFFYNVLFTHSRSKLHVISEKTAEFSVTQDDCMISYLIGASMEGV